MFVIFFRENITANIFWSGTHYFAIFILPSLYHTFLFNGYSSPSFFCKEICWFQDLIYCKGFMLNENSINCFYSQFGFHDELVFLYRRYDCVLVKYSCVLAMFSSLGIWRQNRCWSLRIRRSLCVSFIAFIPLCVVRWPQSDFHFYFAFH